MSHRILCRHGETEFNVENRTRRVFNGQYDTPLTPLGLRQAEELWTHMPAGLEYHLKLAVSSTISRAVHTARIALRQLPYEVPHVVAEEFCERSLGAFEGLLEEEAYARYPDYHRGRNFAMHFEDKTPGGENLTEVTERAWKGLMMVEALMPEGDIAIFSHAATMRCLIGRMLSLPQQRIIDMEISNAKPIVFQKRGEEYVLLSGLEV